MGNWLSSTALALALLAPTGCKEPDPYKFETHLAKIQDSGSRATGFAGLETLTKGVVSAPDNEARLKEFSEKVIPVFEELWASSPEHQEKMLEMLRDVGRPEAAKIWNQALVLDGSSQSKANAKLALWGIRKAKATESVEAIVAELDKLIKNPKDDSGGELRKLMAKTLGELGDRRAVPVLIRLLQETTEKPPAMIHRTAVTALGELGDPAAVGPLVTTIFRVSDDFASDDVRERSKQALAAIGDPAVDQLLQMLKGEHAEIQKLAAEAGLNQFAVAGTAAVILGAIGSPRAAEGLVASFPTNDCAPATGGKKAKGDDDEEMQLAYINHRAVVARALGLVADPKGVDALCTCVISSKNHNDMFEIFNALARIGGSKAVECLSTAIAQAEYSEDLVTAEFVYRPRWDAARFAILAASPEELPKVEAAMATNKDARVKRELAKWEPGIATAKTCGADKDCYLKVLADVNADWFAREKAGFELRRLADGDPAVALELAKAYKVRNPDARVSMAWLSSKILHGKPCPECGKALQDVLDGEKLSMDKSYQEAVLVARGSIAKHGRSAAAAGDGAETPGT